MKLELLGFYKKSTPKSARGKMVYVDLNTNKRYYAYKLCNATHLNGKRCTWARRSYTTDRCEKHKNDADRAETKWEETMMVVEADYTLTQGSQLYGKIWIDTNTNEHMLLHMMCPGTNSKTGEPCEYSRWACNLKSCVKPRVLSSI